MSDKPTGQDPLADFSEPVTSSRYGPQTEKLYQFLISRVIGQERAAHRLARSFAIHNSGLKEPRKPINAVVFSGPTGVGKTMMAGELAKYLIADRDKPPMTEVDCQMFTEHHQLSQLIGSPPGYVGYNEEPLLSQMKIDSFHFWVKLNEHLRKMPPGNRPKDMNAYAAEMYQKLKPYLSVILFDEVEKAHRQIHNALLGIIDKGEATLANGRLTEFSNSVIVLTCNIGGRSAYELLSGKSKRIGLVPTVSLGVDAEAIDEAIYQQTFEMIKKFFPPEFVGRLRDQIVVFRALSREDSRTVLENLLKKVQVRANRQSGQAVGSVKPPPIQLNFSPEFKEMILDEGVSPEFGLRKLEQAVRQRVTLELANAIESGEVRPGDTVLFHAESGKLKIYRKPRTQMSVALAERDTDPIGLVLPPEDGWDPDLPDDGGTNKT